MTDTTNKTENPAEEFLKLILIIAAYAPTAWALATLWEWFGAPLGLPSIGYAHALGLSMLLRFSTGNVGSNLGPAAWKTVFVLWAQPFVAVLLGLIFKSLM